MQSLLLLLLLLLLLILLVFYIYIYIYIYIHINKADLLVPVARVRDEQVSPSRCLEHADMRGR